MGQPHSRRANAAARRTDPRANAELYPVTITAHESVASTASQHDVPPHTATNAVRNGWSGLPTWPCAGKRTTYPPERRRYPQSMTPAAENGGGWAGQCGGSHWNTGWRAGAHYLVYIRRPQGSARKPPRGLRCDADELVLVSLGRTNREIAEKLYISEKTASVHVSNIMAKLEAANRTEAGAKARALGLDRL